jgi:hypothetical protein
MRGQGGQRGAVRRNRGRDRRGALLSCSYLHIVRAPSFKSQARNEASARDGIGPKRHNNFGACLLPRQSPWPGRSLLSLPERTGSDANCSSQRGGLRVVVNDQSRPPLYRRSAARWQLSICLTISGVPQVRPVGRLDPSRPANSFPVAAHDRRQCWRPC